MKTAKQILPVIIFAQFCCTSLWFAGNGVMTNLLENFNLPAASLGYLTSAVQLGFISGTLVFALLNLADRFSPSKVFFICALIGAFFNLGIILQSNTLFSLIFLRFLTGFSLAGIYPVGMKIASDYFEKGLGRSLGFLVGALVLGTAFPHFLKSIETAILSWQAVIVFTSVIASLGGSLILLLVPNGPFRKPGVSPKRILSAFSVFKFPKFRAAAFGYFGHMWELYAFWAFIPVILAGFQATYQQEINIPLFSFIIIGIGSIACTLAGIISEKRGLKFTAGSALSLSGFCCLISPLVFLQPSVLILIIFLCFWGVMVVADSPLFSTLVAQNAPAEIRGTALTLVNSVGFAITIISIQLLTWLLPNLNPVYLFCFLLPGPIFGVISLVRNKSKKNKR